MFPAKCVPCSSRRRPGGHPTRDILRSICCTATFPARIVTRAFSPSARFGSDGARSEQIETYCAHSTQIRKLDLASRRATLPGQCRGGTRVRDHDRRGLLAPHLLQLLHGLFERQRAPSANLSQASARSWRRSRTTAAAHPPGHDLSLTDVGVGGPGPGCRPTSRASARGWCNLRSE